jgi:flagellar FliL protein
MSKKIMILIIAGLLLFFGVVGGGFYMMWTKISTLETLKPVADGEGNGGETEANKEEENKIGLTYPLETFVLNLADKKQRFIRISMSLEYDSKEKLEEIENRMPQIKDAILMLIPSKTSEELKMIDGKITLRKNLMEKLNSIFKDKIITNIYFTEFVIQ